MVFILKRILYHPKEPLLTIGAPSVYKPYPHEKLLSEKEVILNDENKAKELVLMSGSKITKEMLDQMEFSSSNSDETSDESVDEKVEKKPIENLDEVAAKEIDDKLEVEIESSTDTTDKSNEEEMDLEKELVKKFDSKLSIKEINDFAEKSTQKNINEQVEKEPEDAIQEEIKPEQEFVTSKKEEFKPKEQDYVTTKKEDQFEVQSQAPFESSIIEIENTPANIKIPHPEPATQVYQYKPQSTNSLPAKILLERVKEEFNVLFLDLTSETLTLNDLFKKEYTNKFLAIIEDELAQTDVSQKFKSNLHELKTSVFNKSEEQKRRDIDVSYTLDQILQIKERKEIKMNIDKSLFMVSYRREKREDSVTLFRFELNRIAWTNSSSVIDRIKKLKAYKDTEMKQMAEIVFEKAISEDAFCKLYAHVVQNIYKIFKSEEEKKRNETKTVFFITLIQLFQDIFHKKEKWGTEFDISHLSLEERMLMQNKLEDENIKKETKKGRMLGAVKFVSFLYAQNIIGYKGISFCINSLLDFQDEQSVETLCNLLMNCGEKISKSEKHHELSNIVNQLRQPYKWSNRIRYMVSDVLDQCDLWLKEKKKASPFKNAFSALQNTQNKVQNKVQNNEIKNDEAKSIELKNNEPDQIKKSIIRIIENIPQVNDYNLLLTEINEKLPQTDPHQIFKSTLHITIEHFNAFKDDLKFIKFFLNQYDLKKEEVLKILDDLKHSLIEICIDSPFAKNNFRLLVYGVNRWMKIGYPCEGLKEKECEFVDLME